MRRVRILDMPFDNISRAEAAAIVEQFAQGDRARMVCTPNADHVMLIRRDAVFRRIIERADLVVSDGMAVVYASRLLGTRLRENVGGRLLMLAIAARCAARGLRVFLVGGRTAADAERAGRRLVDQFPGLSLAGTYTPPFMADFEGAEGERMLAAVNVASPDVLFVCLGTPKQEKWIAQNLARLHVRVSMGVGAALDLLAGRIPEVPGWMTRVGLEWLFRLAHEPRRLGRRYLIRGPAFIALVLRERLRFRKTRAQE
jgi:N-acetylglucosaminyldiphosphoundecaprenol N-acetyl-beta-D-mannosaminyltransferase